MHKRALLLFTLLLVFLFLSFNASVTAHEGKFELLNSGLPTVTVKISNQTSARLVLIVSSTLCAPRIFLPPESEIVIPDCFRQGLYYSILAVFYDDKRVLGRLPDQFFLAIPEAHWIFFESGGR